LIREGEQLKNNECTTYILFKGQWAQKFKKGENGWKLYSRNGNVRPCTAEQFLSHLLPALAGIKGPNITVRVEPDGETATKNCSGKAKQHTQADQEESYLKP